MSLSFNVKWILVFTGLFILSACTSQTVASADNHIQNENKQVMITWHEPEKYRDVRSPDGGQERYQNNIFKQLDKHFQKMATKFLSDGYTIKMKVTDVNLAGDTRFYNLSHPNIRVVKPIHWPSMAFEYELYQDSELIKKESVKLKDMAFMERSGIGRKSDHLYYEKRLINEWFKDEVVLAITQWKRAKTAVMS